MRNFLVKVMALAFVASILLPSCASIVSKTSYPVSINSHPLGANLSIVNKKGIEVYRGNTPATVILKPASKYMSGEQYLVTFSAPGYDSQTVTISSSLNGWYWGNILFGGLIGWLIVDPLTGAMYKLNDAPINVTLGQTLNTSENKDASSFKIMDIKDVPDELKDCLVKIN